MILHEGACLHLAWSLGTVDVSLLGSEAVEPLGQAVSGGHQEKIVCVCVYACACTGRSCVMFGELLQMKFFHSYLPRKVVSEEPQHSLARFPSTDTQINELTGGRRGQGLHRKVWMSLGRGQRLKS